MVERLIRNQQVAGSIPAGGSSTCFAKLLHRSVEIMEFDPALYGAVAESLLLAAGWPGHRMPLVIGDCNAPTVRAQLHNKKATDIFPNALHPNAALSGLYLYVSCFEESHNLAQDIKNADGSYWHAILHRQEPDAANASYWFHKVGSHATFPDLAKEAEALGYKTKTTWDPHGFLTFCAAPANKKLALEIQHAEWQLLFHHCARTKSA